MNDSKNQVDNRWPDRYFAAIFTTQRSQSGDDVYEIMAGRMIALAQKQQGFLGLESVRGDDGMGITVSYWTDRRLSKIGGGKPNTCLFRAWAGRNSINGTEYVLQKFSQIGLLCLVTQLLQVPLPSYCTRFVSGYCSLPLCFIIGPRLDEHRCHVSGTSQLTHRFRTFHE